jgi:hypothetical protein
LVNPVATLTSGPKTPGVRAVPTGSAGGAGRSPRRFVAAPAREVARPGAGRIPRRAIHAPAGRILPGADGDYRDEATS